LVGRVPGENFLGRSVACGHDEGLAVQHYRPRTIDTSDTRDTSNSSGSSDTRHILHHHQHPTRHRGEAAETGRTASSSLEDRHTDIHPSIHTYIHTSIRQSPPLVHRNAAGQALGRSVGVGSPNGGRVWHGGFGGFPPPLARKGPLPPPTLHSLSEDEGADED
jgi:hypothetical protein